MCASMRFKKEFPIVGFNFTGLLENPKPVYDVFYLIDLSPDYIELVRDGFNKIFADGVAHDAVIVGHGDWVVDQTGLSIIDRALQLTPVTKLPFSTRA